MHSKFFNPYELCFFSTQPIHVCNVYMCVGVCELWGLWIYPITIYPAHSLTYSQCMEKVVFLHLGFNKLRTIPQFASKATYTLTALNLRNNELDTIEGECVIVIMHVYLS